MIRNFYLLAQGGRGEINSEAENECVLCYSQLDKAKTASPPSPTLSLTLIPWRAGTPIALYNQLVVWKSGYVSYRSRSGNM